MAFCVECGAEGKVYGGLCGRCLAARRTFFGVPETLDLAECGQCHALRVGDHWTTAPLEEALDRLVRGAVTVASELASPVVAHREAREDDRNILVTVEGRGSLDGLAIAEAHPVRVRIKGGLCDVCGRQRGHYYEGVLQVRASGRPLRPWEEARVGELVGARTDRREGRREFLAREERVPGGIDYYLSSNALAKTLSKEVQQALGGAITASPKLHSRRGGRDLYRVTYLVRLPPYAVGDVVEVGRDLYQVVGAGGNVTAVELRSGRRRTFRPGDLARARVVDHGELEGRLLARSHGGLRVLDPRTGATHTLGIPEGFEPTGDRVPLVEVGGRLYVAPLAPRRWGSPPVQR